jgi:hypothetical protein
MSYLIAAVCALSWAYIAAPLASRLFGIRMPISWRERWSALQRLRLAPFIFSYGVLTFGMSGFVFSVTEALAEWGTSSELWNAGLVPAPLSSGRRMLLMFATWVWAGVLIGWLTGKIRNAGRCP